MGPVLNFSRGARKLYFPECEFSLCLTTENTNRQSLGHSSPVRCPERKRLRRKRKATPFLSTQSTNCLQRRSLGTPLFWLFYRRFRKGKSLVSGCAAH